MVIIDSMLIWSIGKLLKDGGRKDHKNVHIILFHTVDYLHFHAFQTERKKGYPQEMEEFSSRIGKIWEL